jgi:hypothetical protein
MTDKQIKTGAIVGAVLVGGIIIYAIANAKKNPKVTGNSVVGTGMGTPKDVELKNQIDRIASATGVDKGLISVGDAAFIAAWDNAIKAGNDTFSYKGTYFNTSDGQQFS